jgi:hypothetical protein
MPDNQQDSNQSISTGWPQVCAEVDALRAELENAILLVDTLHRTIVYRDRWIEELKSQVRDLRKLNSGFRHKLQFDL